MRTIKLCATPPARPATLLGLIRRTAIELERDRSAPVAQSAAQTHGTTKTAFA